MQEEQTESVVESASELAPLESNHIQLVVDRLQADPEGLVEIITAWPEGEIAAALEALPVPDRLLFWRLIPAEKRGDTLSWLHEQVRESLLDRLEVEDVVAAASSLEAPYLAEVVDEADIELRDAILESLSSDGRFKVEDILSYPEDTAGRLMQQEWIAVRKDVTLEVVKRYLLLKANIPRNVTALMVVDRDGLFLGELFLESLLTRNPQTTVEEVMQTDAAFINVRSPLSEVATLFQRRDLVSLPVVDDLGHLVGRIVIDDAISLVRKEAEEPMMHMAGLEADEDLLAPIFISARRRMIWLGINLATAFLAAWVIGLFESALDKIVALAVLMPIVASMGGIAGSQTLTLAIRGLALGQISDANTRWLARKEITISIISGLTWAIVVGIIAWLWFDNPGISLVLGFAMIVNLLVAAASGLAIPLILARFGLDPALSGSVVLTTVTDVVGFMCFLGLATLFLL